MVKRKLQMPYVPNMIKAMAISPPTLKVYLGMLGLFYEHATLPQSLVSIIHFTVAEKSNCTYCAAGNEVMCRTLGVDEETLKAIAHDLGDVNPERIRVIIEFALKAGLNPQELEPADYDAVRAQGITNEEIVEIILVAGMAVLADIMADGLKVELEQQVVDALAQ
jgi:alkylhydroperoxidase family enzyme